MIGNSDFVKDRDFCVSDRRFPFEGHRKNLSSLYDGAGCIVFEIPDTPWEMSVRNILPMERKDIASSFVAHVFAIRVWIGENPVPANLAVEESAFLIKRGNYEQR